MSWKLKSEYTLITLKTVFNLAAVWKMLTREIFLKPFEIISHFTLLQLKAYQAVMVVRTNYYVSKEKY